MRQVVALGSLKGAPGASTLALAMAAAWPNRDEARPVVVEADASGGDLAVRFRLSDMTGLLALAARVAQDGPDWALGDYVQEISWGMRVVSAPAGPDQAASCVAQIAACPSVLRGEADDQGIVLLDLGHLGSGPSQQLAREADRLVLVARGSTDALAHIAARPQWLEGVRAELVVMGECPYADSDIAKALHMDLGQIHMAPWDVRAASSLRGVTRVTGRGWGRSPLAHAAARLARHLSGIDAKRQRQRDGLVGELAPFAMRAVPQPDGSATAEGDVR